MYYRFIGKDGSLGFVRGNIYDLEVCRDNNGITIYSKPGVRCPYSSLKTFQENWESVEVIKVNNEKSGKTKDKKDEYGVSDEKLYYDNLFSSKGCISPLNILEGSLLTAKDEEKLRNDKETLNKEFEQAFATIIDVNRKAQLIYMVANNTLYDRGDYRATLLRIMRILNPNLPKYDCDINLKKIKPQGFVEDMIFEEYEYYGE